MYHRMERDSPAGHWRGSQERKLRTSRRVKGAIDQSRSFRVRQPIPAVRLARASVAAALEHRTIIHRSAPDVDE